MRKIGMVFAMCLCAFGLHAASVYVSSGTVVRGQWNSNYHTARTYAENNHLPMIIYWGSGCAKCKTMERAMAGADFVAWQEKFNAVMVFCEGDNTTDGKDCHKDAKNSSEDFPYVYAYWKKANGEIVERRFTGRSGTMISKTGSLFEQFKTSIETVFAGWTGEGGSSGTDSKDEPNDTPVITDPFAGGQTYTAAALDSASNVCGVISLTAAKAKYGESKLSGSFTTLAGVKCNLVAQKVLVNGKYVTTTLTFKKLDGSYTVKLSRSGITGAYVRQFLVGGLKSANPTVAIANLDGIKIPDGYRILTEYLPDGVTFANTSSRWTFAKAPVLKYAKNKETKLYELIGDDNPLKPNVSALKLTYAKKTGAFKGSFKVYLTNATEAPAKKPTLKTVTVKVAGFVIGDYGYGVSATNGVTVDMLID